MQIRRKLADSIKNNLNRGKIILLFGARQVGKTTLIKNVLDALEHSCISIVGDDKDYASVFSSQSLQKIKEVVGDHDLLFIDEAQVIPNIGQNIKLLHDAHPELKIILTGSSAFDLANRTKEALTGRTITYQLHPISIPELLHHNTPFEIKQNLNKYIVYGSYPEVLNISNKTQRIKHLKELSESYLYRDILQLTSIKHTSAIHNLLKLIALQLGGLVSIQELSNSLNLGFDTVRSYIEMLEKSFVIKSLSGFSRNPRKEISKMDKIYFIDTGIRNAIINNFNELEYRTDAGPLWENFLVMERTKLLDYHDDHAQQFFWRKYSGAEIDYVETKDDQLNGFEFKWQKRKSRSGHSWKTDYRNSNFETITKENFIQFVTTL